MTATLGSLVLDADGCPAAALQFRSVCNESVAQKSKGVVKMPPQLGSLNATSCSCIFPAALCAAAHEVGGHSNAHLNIQRPGADVCQLGASKRPARTTQRTTEATRAPQPPANQPETEETVTEASLSDSGRGITQ